MKPDDLCPRPVAPPESSTSPLADAIQLSTVWRCDDPAQADALLSGQSAGYVYRRDRHPNADALAEKCRLLHEAERAAVCASGMAALATILLSQCQTGDHVVVSDQLYGRTQTLFVSEAARLGITATLVDACDSKAVASAFRPNTKLAIVETIANPTLRVCDISALADLCHQRGARLVVDNTFASPAVFRPLASGADFVMESLTKIMNGHSDVLLGLIAGREAVWERVPGTLATFGFVANPLECWLASRGIGTLALRVERANANALAVARHLEKANGVASVRYPGLESHPDHALARRQFGEHFGAIVTFSLAGGIDAATRFIRATRIPFAPSLGELETTLSHPQSTSHRAVDKATRKRLGIDPGMIRLSVGIESPEFILAALDEALAAV